jgi:hypothetical protein
LSKDLTRNKQSSSNSNLMARMFIWSYNFSREDPGRLDCGKCR